MATKKTNKNKGTGFAGPAIGTVHPKGSTVRRLPNGRIEIVEPKAKSKRKK